MFGLTTMHGTVLCFDRAAERVCHRTPHAVALADLVLVTGVREPDFGVLEPSGAWRSLDLGTPGPSRATVPPVARVTVGATGANFAFGGGYLVAPPDGTVRLDGGKPLDWETFGLVERDAMADLLDLCGDDWFRVGARARIPQAEIRLVGRDQLRLGPHVYPLSGNLPFAGRFGGSSAGRRRRLMFREGWMVDAFERFRPLVYFVLMGGNPAYAAQLRLATESLLAFGQYTGDVLVITDRDRETVEALVPAALLWRLSILRVASSDKVDAVLARLMVGEHPGASGYAPILYSDTDVVFDRPLAPFLEAVLVSGRMSAQSEPWNELPGADAAGGELFALDPTEVEDRIGFNAGVWAMPGGADSLEVVDTIRHSISRFLQAHGRESLPWLDQAMANYVLRKLGAYDARLMTDATRLCQAGEAIGSAAARGFVHFWPVSHRADERAASMAAYVERLRARG